MVSRRSQIGSTVCCFGLMFCSTWAIAQQPNSRLLDRKADALQQEFLTELETLATEYEEAGLYDRAKETLRKRQKIERSEDVQERIKKIDERDFDTKRKEIVVTPERGWSDSGLEVTKGEPVRLEVEGQVRIILNQEVGPGGLAMADGVSDVPAGALIAVVYPPREGKKKPQPTKPRVIDGRTQFEPEKSGRLFLRVAVPVGAKVKGEYQIVVSGKIEPAGRPSRR